MASGPRALPWVIESMPFGQTSNIMPRYTLRDLFLMTTLIALGTGGMVYVCRNQTHFSPDTMLGWLAIFIASMASIVAGALTPFHVKKVAVVAGTGVMVIFVILFWLTYRVNH